MSFILTIPTELQILIGCFLDFKDFCRLKSTCRTLSNSLEQYKVKGASLDIWKKAIQFEKPKIIKILLHSVIEFAAEEQSFFILALERENAEVVKLLLQDQRFDPCVSTKWNMSTLFISSEKVI
jgi:hypothetical protein